MAWSNESRQSRGYGAEWDCLRKEVLERDYGICQPCKAKGRIHGGTHVDHVISKAKAKVMGWTRERTDHPSNLQCINEDCHRAKTEEEQGKTLRPKVKIGVDGWPVEGDRG